MPLANTRSRRRMVSWNTLLVQLGSLMEAITVSSFFLKLITKTKQRKSAIIEIMGRLTPVFMPSRCFLSILVYPICRQGVEWIGATCQCLTGLGSRVGVLFVALCLTPYPYLYHLPGRFKPPELAER